MELSKFDQQMEKQGWISKHPFMCYVREASVEVALPGKVCLAYRDFYNENDLNEEIDISEYFTIKEISGEDEEWKQNLVLELLRHARYHQEERQFNFFKRIAQEWFGMSEEETGTFKK